MSDRLLTIEQAQELLHLSRGKLYDLLRSGELLSFHIGTARRIPESALQAFIADRIAKASA